MYPTLVEIPILDEPIPAYFTMLMIGFALAIFLGVRWAKREGVDHQLIIDLGLQSLLWGIIGARILHVFVDGYFWDYVHMCTNPDLVHWQIPRRQCIEIEGRWDTIANICRPAERDCLAWAKFWNGGLTYYGGLIAGIYFGIRFMRRWKMPAWRVADLFGMVAPLGLFWGRMGCFLGGCCFGHVTDSDLGVRFPRGSSASETQFKEGLLSSPTLESLPVHPTQLYEAIGCLAISAFLMFYLYKRRRFDGMIVLAFLGLYAVLRFGVEFLRADDRGGLWGLSTSQWLSLIALAACAVVWRRIAKAAAISASPTTDAGH